MNVLVACEESQEVCKAFRAKGHMAFSCDIQECSGGHPEWHIQGDALKILDPDCPVFFTQDGSTHTHTMGLANCPPAMHIPFQCSHTAIFPQMLSTRKGDSKMGRTGESIRVLHAVYACGCADDMRGKPCRLYELRIPQGRPNHTPVLLCRGRERCGELPRKAHLPVAERASHVEAHERITTATAHVYLSWRKEQRQKDRMVRGYA